MHISPKPLRARCRDYHDFKTTCIFGYLLEVILFNLEFPAIGRSIYHIRIPGFWTGSSLHRRLIREVILSKNSIYSFSMIFLHMSLHYKWVQVPLPTRDTSGGYVVPGGPEKVAILLVASWYGSWSKAIHTLVYCLVVGVRTWNAVKPRKKRPFIVTGASPRRRTKISDRRAASWMSNLTDKLLFIFIGRFYFNY